MRCPVCNGRVESETTSFRVDAGPGWKGRLIDQTHHYCEQCDGEFVATERRARWLDKRSRLNIWSAV